MIEVDHPTRQSDQAVKQQLSVRWVFCM